MQFYDFELTSGLLALYNIMRICEDIPYKLQIYSQRFVCFCLFFLYFFRAQIYSRNRTSWYMANTSLLMTY